MNIMRVDIIPSKEAHEWVLYKHYAKRIPSISYAYGLFNDNNILNGVVTYGSPASPFLCVGVCGPEYRDIVVELNRLVINDGFNKNSASFLIGKSLKLIPKPKIIVSYADTSQGHIGYVYQATNWTYTGMTKERTDISTQDGKHSRHYNKKIDYSQNRKIRTAKHRYVYFCGNRKHMLKELKYPVLPYPKGKSKRYRAEYKTVEQMNLFKAA